MPNMLLNQFKFVVFCVFVAISQIMFAQRPVTDTNYVDNKGRKQGVWKKNDPQGLSYIGQFKDDKPYGRFVHFDKHGQTVIINDYFRDGFATKTTYFYPNGKIRATGFYLDKLRDSVWQFYDTIGRMIRKDHYLNGMLHGLTEVFDKNGDRVETIEWYRDLRNGQWWQKTEVGTQTTTYKLNLSHGVYEATFANGNPYIKGYYEDGLKEKTWYFYHENGLLDRVMLFKKNQILKKQVAINVKGKDILIDSDSVAYLHTNGKMVELKMLDNTVYRPSQTFEQLVGSLDTDDFFLATSQFLAPLKLYDSMIEDKDNPVIYDTDSEEVKAEKQEQRKALLKLKIPTPYDIYINGEVIDLLKGLTNSKPVED